MAIGAGARRQAEINVTPMIDILLVLIIIFMVITPLASKGLNTLVPQEPRPEREPPSAGREIVISVHADKTVWLNQEPVELADLERRLARLFRNGAHRVVFVRGVRDLEFRQVAEVVDIAKSAGIDRVALMTH